MTRCRRCGPSRRSRRRSNMLALATVQCLLLLWASDHALRVVVAASEVAMGRRTEPAAVLTSDNECRAVVVNDDDDACNCAAAAETNNRNVESDVAQSLKGQATTTSVVNASTAKLTTTAASSSSLPSLDSFGVPQQLDGSALTPATEDEDDEEDEDEEDLEDDEEEDNEDAPADQDDNGEDPASISEVLQHRLLETQRYLAAHGYDSAFYATAARPWCYNHHEACTAWAYHGECQSNPPYMTQHCVPACHWCHLLPHDGLGYNVGTVQVLAATVTLEDAVAEAQQEEEDDDDEEEEEYGDDELLGSVSIEDLEDYEELEGDLEDEGEQVAVVDPEAVVAKVRETERYVNTVIWNRDNGQHFDPYAKVRAKCRNYHSHCSLWAVQGHCDDEDDDREFMLDHCPAACQVCHELHYETRCPINVTDNVWQAGDLNRMFERVVQRYSNVTVWSRPSDDPEQDGPWIVTLDDFVTAEEAQTLIDWGGFYGYEPSELAGSTDDETGETLDSLLETEDRTSLNAWCAEECLADPVVQRLYQRLQHLTGIPPSHSEQLQLLKYEVGEFYVLHSDGDIDDAKAMSGPRILTVFMYLNTVVDEGGGETRFEHGDIHVQAQRGRIVLWPSVLDRDPSAHDDRTWHEARPVLAGQKFGANAWFHLRNQQQAAAQGC